MKRIVLVLLFLGAVSHAFADPPGEDVHRPHAGGGKWYLQFDLGLNWSFLNGNSAYRPLMRALDGSTFEGQTDMFNSANGIGPLFGASLGYAFSDHFALSLGVHYDARHVSRTESTRDTLLVLDTLSGLRTPSPELVSKEFKVNADYVTFSLFGNLSIEHFFIYLGPRVSIPVARTISETDHIVDDSSTAYYFPATVDSTKTITESRTGATNVNTRVSVTIGAGYVFEMSKKVSLVPQLGFDIGFTDLLGASEVNALHGQQGTSSLPTDINPKMRVNALQATIGLRINL